MKRRSIIFYLQTGWIVFSGGLSWGLAKIFCHSLIWGIPLFLIIWFFLAWTGISLISLMDPDVRLCVRLGIKIENLPIYRQAFNEMVAMEERGEDYYALGKSMQDQEDWMRYCAYEFEKSIAEMPHNT